MAKHDFLVLGAGIFGLTTAIELRQRQFSVGVLNPGRIPHPLAASTDISKVVRMEYGTDPEYLDLVADCLPVWRAWNELFGETLYHETGFLVLARQGLDGDQTTFEGASYHQLLKKGYHPERLNPALLAQRFPAFATAPYTDGFYHPLGGWAEAGRVVEALAGYARQLGVDICENQTAEQIFTVNNCVTGVTTREGGRFAAGHIVVCAGNFTPYLVPELKPYMRITGHPVFHLKPPRPERFAFPDFTVFAADISNTGWYGFPLHPREGVVKVANHGPGLELHPEHDERVVYEQDHHRLRQFLEVSIPALAGAPVVYTRRCCYTDTLDGHFWIDRHPEIEGLTIGSGGSGHAFKMAPALGSMIAAAALGEPQPRAARYRWRHLTASAIIEEEARFVEHKK